MIKLAAMTSVFPDWDIGEIVAGLKCHGYQGVEPRVEWDHACGIEATLPAEARTRIRDQFAAEGLDICCIATSVRMATADHQERADQVEALKGYIDLAGDLGCPLLRTFGGKRGDGELTPIVDYVADGYRQVMEQAASRDVTVLMETHDDWCHTAPVRAVVELVDDPRLRVLWDFMHPQRMMETVAESFSAIGELTAHTHGHDGRFDSGRLEFVDWGTGTVDHAAPLRLLQNAGFDGYFSIEIIHAPGSEYDADGVLNMYAEGFRAIGL